MHFQSLTQLTLVVSTLLASGAIARPHAGHGTLHRNLHNSAKRAPRASPLAQRDALSDLQSEVKSFEDFMTGFVKAGSTDSSALGQLQSQVATHIQAVTSFVSAVGPDSNGRSTAVLQTDASAFKSWIDDWAQGVSYTSSDSALSQLGSELTSYEGWLNAWLGLPGGASTGTAPSVPQPTSVSGPSTTLLTTVISQTSTDTVITTQVMTGTPPASPPAASPTPSPVTSAEPEPSPSSASEVVTSSAPAAATSAVAKPSPTGSSGGSPPPSGGSGKPILAGWWGQTSAASTYDLDAICSDPSFDIVMLSFLNEFFTGAANMPNLNLGPSTGQPTTAQVAAGATGLFDGSELASAITKCQSSGKKVMLTLGGAAGYSDSAFTSDGQAQEFAGTVWDLFLGGQSPLRPFGDIKLDGIDVDNENKDQTGYVAFVQALRQKFGEDSSKDYLISGAPQCPQPDASIPLEAMKLMDYVWVQFYNNPSCQHGAGGGFTSSVRSWSQSLAGSNAKLLIGAVADQTQGTGYVDAATLAAEVAEVQGLALDNYAGYAIWDASLAMKNGGMQSSIKSALA